MESENEKRARKMVEDFFSPPTNQSGRLAPTIAAALDEAEKRGAEREREACAELVRSFEYSDNLDLSCREIADAIRNRVE